MWEGGQGTGDGGHEKSSASSYLVGFILTRWIQKAGPKIFPSIFANCGKIQILLDYFCGKTANDYFPVFVLLIFGGTGGIPADKSVCIFIPIPGMIGLYPLPSI